MTNDVTRQPQKQMPEQRKLKETLENKKIYFETIAAALLSVMAIIVSIFQTISGCQQTNLTAIQTELARQQWEAEQKRIAIHKSADWQKLRDVIWEIMDQYPPSGVLALDKLDSDSKASWFSNIRRLLDSQTGNPALIQDKVCKRSPGLIQRNDKIRCPAAIMQWQAG